MLETCPNCGAEVPAEARACPECGADEQTGWSERAACQRLGVPDPEFDYTEFVKEEFGGGPARRSPNWIWIVMTLVLIAALLGLLR